MMSHSRVPDLLRKIDKYSAEHPGKSHIMDPPAILYNITKQMYNTYKKSNQLKILQNKIYTLQLAPEQIQTDRHTPVTLSMLCKANELDVEAVGSLILMKNYLSGDLRKQAISNIVQQLESASDLGVVLKAYKKLLKTPECLENPFELYNMVQKSMIKKILSFHLASHDFAQISRFIISLPYLHYNAEILKFIGELFEKAKILQDFVVLLQIYNRIVENDHKQTELSKSPLFSLEHFQAVCEETTIKITIPPHIQKIKQKLIHQESCSQSFLRNIQKQAQHKLQLLFIQNPPISEQQSLTDKEQAVMNFIFTVLAVCPHLWQYLINLHQHMPTIFQEYCQKWMEEEAIDELLRTHTLTSGINVVLAELIRNEDERIISRIFLTKILGEAKVETGQEMEIQQKQGEASRLQRLLFNKNIRKFISLKIMQEQNEYYWNQVIENQNEHIDNSDIVLEMFSFPEQCVKFYKKTLEYPRREKLETFLTKLSVTKPNKLKEFFIRVDQTLQGEIFQHHEYYMVKFLGKIATPAIAISIVRDMASYPPSRFCISIMFAFASSLSGQGAKTLITQSYRTLNMLLITRSYDELSTQFKDHLEDFSKKYNIAEQIFRQVPEKMINPLTEYYKNPKR